MARLYRQKVARLSELLEDESTKAEAMQTIRALIDQVVLRPENGELRMDLKGEIAAILRLCRSDQDTQKPAAFGDGLDEQIKVVAGARNHLSLLFEAPGLRR